MEMDKLGSKMKEVINYVIGAFIFINVIAFLLYAIDKYKAIRHRWRIPEKTLLLLPVFGGSIGSVIAMLLFHHKVRKWYFWTVNLIMLILWGVMVVAYLQGRFTFKGI